MVVKYEKRIEVEKRRTEVAKLYLRKWPIWKISDELKIAYQNVRADIRWLRKEWREVRASQVQRIIDEQLSVIDAVENEAWASWEKSCKDAVKQTMRMTETPGVAPTEGAADTPAPAPRNVTVAKEGQCGDPRFLTIVQECVDRRAKLLDAYKTVVKGDGPEGAVLVKVIGPGMSMSDI